MLATWACGFSFFDQYVKTTIKLLSYMLSMYIDTESLQEKLTRLIYDSRICVLP